MKSPSSSDKHSGEQSLWQLATAKQGTYALRTHCLDQNGAPKYINRLIMEDSPYLLQHAHNPVNWYAWGVEAFAVAQQENKPVFLSIGYSTCHWCHVMEEESFDNEEIARLLNQHFISIKLDREQQPDIDEYYMTATQFISGHGGWPMSNFLLPDGKPFYCATYFPAAQFAALLTRIHELWQTRPQELMESAAKVSDSVAGWLNSARGAEHLDLEEANVQAKGLLEREDSRWGGLAGAPKFPQEPLLAYFLDLANRDRDPAALGFVCRALEAMAAGGIHDQIGGGFHRYSVDAQWLVPHFEKMLYNQSQLSPIYLLAWQLTGSGSFLRVVTRTLDYVLREMQLPEGGFYSATDADSEGVEGRYFVWSFAQLQECLTQAELNLLQQYFDLSPEGNFEGENIFSLRQSRFSSSDHVDNLKTLDPVLLKLRQLRSLRIAPLRDEKRIVAWAAAMAGSLAQAGYALDNSAYLDSAMRAIKAIWESNFEGSQTLQRIYLHGKTSMRAQLEDYAALCEALLVLFDASGDLQQLRQADLLMQQILQRFWNGEGGGFFNNEIADAGPKLARSSHAADGATFSAIGVTLACLINLHNRRALVGRDDGELEQYINRTIAAHAREVMENPAGHVTFLRAVMTYRHGSCGLVQYAAGGRVKVSVSKGVVGQGSGDSTACHQEVTFRVHMAEGWYLSSGQRTDLSPVKLSLGTDEPGWELESVLLSPGTPATGKLEGDFLLQARCRRKAITDPFNASIGLVLTVQACSDRLCLAVEQLNFRV